MPKDYDLLFSEAQLITASAASTNYLNPSVVQNLGNAAFVEVNVTTVLDSAGEAATLTVGIQVDDNSSFTSATTLVSSGTIVEADLVAGKQILIPIPFNRIPTEYYMRLYYTAGTENFTSGAVTAHIVFNPQTNS